MPPRHNPNRRRVRPVRNRGQRPAPPPACKLTPEEVAELRTLMKTQLGGREPRIFQVDLVQAQEERRDALCQAATGQGKTAVAAGPYVLEKNADRVTLMVSPLIGLQNEMVQTFKDEFQLSAIAVNSSTDGGCSSELMNDIVNGKHRIVLLSPEMLLSPAFVNGVLRHPDFASRIYSVIIDEAHCISHWGSDFRKEYGRIGVIRVFLPCDTPIIALSASLTARVIEDIVHTLQLNRSNYLFRNLGNDRSNVSLVVRAIHNPQSSYSDLDFLIPSAASSLSDIPKIWIYADNIDVGTDIIDHIRSLLPEEFHDSIRPYNAVHNDEYRAQAMKLFRDGKLRILVCTDAAGMGCNIPDIDIVVQWKLPAKLSSFIQRAGRAARDPTRSGLAVLLVEPAAYSISTAVKNVESEQVSKGSKVKKQGRGGRSKGQGFWKKATTKGYAASRGRHRGGRTCTDSIEALDEPEYDRGDPSEGLYNFVQATTCRRRIIGEVFNNPDASPTALCCDICDPKLLDRTRPGIRKVSRGRGIQYAANTCDALVNALDRWRDDIMARDEPQSLIPSSCILPDCAVDKLSKLALPLSSGGIQTFLAPQWHLWATYGQELTDMMLAVDTRDQASISSPPELRVSATQGKHTRASPGIEEMRASSGAKQNQQDIHGVAPARKKARLVQPKPQIVNKPTSLAKQSAAFHVNPQPVAPTSQQLQPSHSAFGIRMAVPMLTHNVFPAPSSAPIPSTSSLTMPTSQSISPAFAHSAFISTPTPVAHEGFVYPTSHEGILYDVAPVQAFSRHPYTPRFSGSAPPQPSFGPYSTRYDGVSHSVAHGVAPARSLARQLYTPRPSGSAPPPSPFESFPISHDSAAHGVAHGIVPAQSLARHLYMPRSSAFGPAAAAAAFESYPTNGDVVPAPAPARHLYMPRPSGPALSLPSFKPYSINHDGAAYGVAQGVIPAQSLPRDLYMARPSGSAPPPSSFEPYSTSHDGVAYGVAQGVAPAQSLPRDLYTPRPSGSAPPPSSFEPYPTSQDSITYGVAQGFAPAQSLPRNLYTPRPSGSAPALPSFEPYPKNQDSVVHGVSPAQYPHATQGAFFTGDVRMTHAQSARHPAALASPAMPTRQYADSQFSSPYPSIPSPDPYHPYLHAQYSPYSAPQVPYPHRHIQQPR